MKARINKTAILTATALTALLAGQAQAACTPQHTLNANGALANTKPDAIYTDHGDGTVTDNETGLMWTKCALPMDYVAQPGGGGMICDATGGGATEYNSWANAMTAADDANTNSHFGHNDWRLPNIKELASLADLACYGSTIGASGALNMDFFDLTTIVLVLDPVLGGQFPEPQYPSYLWSSSVNINVASQVRMMAVHNGATVLRDKSGVPAAVMLVRDAATSGSVPLAPEGLH